MVNTSNIGYKENARKSINFTLKILPEVFENILNIVEERVVKQKVHIITKILNRNTVLNIKKMI